MQWVQSQQCLRLVKAKPILQHRLDIMRSGEGINFHNKLQKVKDQDTKRGMRKASGTSRSGSRFYRSHPKETEKLCTWQEISKLGNRFSMCQCSSVRVCEAHCWKCLFVSAVRGPIFAALICIAQATADLKTAPALEISSGFGDYGSVLTILS